MLKYYLKLTDDTVTDPDQNTRLVESYKISSTYQPVKMHDIIMFAGKEWEVIAFWLD